MKTITVAVGVTVAGLVAGLGLAAPDDIDHATIAAANTTIATPPPA